MIGLDGAFGYYFILGVVAAINPCGFVMLPTYLMYFLGLEGSRPGTQRASLQRALIVSSATSAGFMAVFIVIGTVSRLFTTVIEENAKYAGFVIGVGLIVLGCFMLAGWKPAFALPQVGAGKERSQTFVSMFGFGVAYAVASLGCTIPIFIAVIFGSFGARGFVSGVASVAVYGVGMALLVTALTVTLAFASGGLLQVLRSALKFMDRVAALFVMIAGFYLTWYWYTDITERGSDGLKSRAEQWQSRLATFVSDAGPWTLVIVLGAIVVAGIAYVAFAKPRKQRAE